MCCSPDPQWLKDFKQEIEEEFNLSSLDATCIAGKVARIVRKRDRKVCEWITKEWVKHDCDTPTAISRFRKAMEENNIVSFKVAKI